MVEARRELTCTIGRGPRRRGPALVLACVMAIGVLGGPWRAVGQEPPAPAEGKPPAPDALTRALARFEEEPEPARSVKRAWVSVLYLVHAGDARRAAAGFHPELRMHRGGGEFDPLPPEALAALLEERARAVAGRAPWPVERVVDLGTVRAWSRAGAREVERAPEGSMIEPARVAQFMADGDWLAVGRALDPDLGREVLFVLREHEGRWKVVLAE